MSESFGLPSWMLKVWTYPLINLHSSTTPSLPLISQPCRFRKAVKAASFPSGEAKGCRLYAFTIQQTALFRQLREHIPFAEPSQSMAVGQKTSVSAQGS